MKTLNSKPRSLSTERLNQKGTKTPTETKRKRRSTGDKRAAKRSKEPELKKTSMTPTVEKNQDQQQESVEKMSNIEVNTIPPNTGEKNQPPKN